MGAEVVVSAYQMSLYNVIPLVTALYQVQQFLLENNRIQNQLFYTFIHSTEEM